MFEVSLAARGGDHLLGASAAEQMIAALWPTLSELPPGEIILLDFEGVTAVNGSFIRSSLLYLYVCGRVSAGDSTLLAAVGRAGGLRPLDIYPICYRLLPDVRDEIDEVFRPREVPFLLARVVKESRLIEADIGGHLGMAPRQTLAALVAAGGEATAAQLSHGRDLGRTAWNNRLNELVALRLCRKLRVGREWCYRTVAERFSWEKNF